MRWWWWYEIRGKACESGWCVGDSLRKVPTVGLLGRIKPASTVNNYSISCKCLFQLDNQFLLASTMSSLPKLAKCQTNEIPICESISCDHTTRIANAGYLNVFRGLDKVNTCQCTVREGSSATTRFGAVTAPGFAADILWAWTQFYECEIKTNE